MNSGTTILKEGGFDASQTRLALLRTLFINCSRNGLPYHALHGLRKLDKPHTSLESSPCKAFGLLCALFFLALALAHLLVVISDKLCHVPSPATALSE
jgi:hypothetical protein